jgi:hypothetical protein
MKLLPVLILITVALLGLGCGEDQVSPNASNSPSAANAASLMGLHSGRTLMYLQTDTVVSVDSVYDVEVKAANMTVVMDGSDDDWIVVIDEHPIMNLKVSDGALLMNGYWTNEGGSDVLHYFASPPILIERTLSKETGWTGYTPFFTTGSTDQVRAIYTAYFGFHFIRRYIGVEEVTVPAGIFDAHRLEVELFLRPWDTAPAATAVEHYASGVGLVRLQWRGGSLNRTLSLYDYD